MIGEEYIGVHEMVAHAIQKSDLDLRKTLYSNIVLAGGNTLFPGTQIFLINQKSGFGDRLLDEVKRLSPKDVHLKISAPPERKYSNWMGGSILASLTTFKKMWVAKDEYEEDGAAVIHRKTF